MIKKRGLVSMLTASALAISALVVTMGVSAETTLDLYCPTGDTNISYAGGVPYHFNAYTPDGRYVANATPKNFRLCTENHRYCKAPEIHGNYLVCYYVLSNAAEPWTFKSTTPFRTQQDPRAFSKGATFLKLKSK